MNPWGCRDLCQGILGGVKAHARFASILDEVGSSVPQSAEIALKVSRSASFANLIVLQFFKILSELRALFALQCERLGKAHCRI